MMKKVAASVLAAGVLVGGLSVATVLPAQADTTQKICSSKNSTEDVHVYVYSTSEPYALGRGECVPYRVAKGGSFIELHNSYRVGYGGDYSDCRGNSGFTPYRGADSVYFRTYSGTYC